MYRHLRFCNRLARLLQFALGNEHSHQSPEPADRFEIIPGPRNTPVTRVQSSVERLCFLSQRQCGVEPGL